MKKLNRKGFTLVELLAVIIVLAIVVGISIPAVLGTINGSKNKACGVAVEAAQKYLENQLVIYNTDTSMATPAFAAEGNNLAVQKSGTDKYYVLNDDEKKMVGLKLSNVTKVYATNNGDGTFCVEIVNIPETSEYYSTEYWNKTVNTSSTTISAKTGAKNKSSHCA